MWCGVPMHVFLKFEFRVGRSPNFGATGGQISPFPIQHTIAYTTACRLQRVTLYYCNLTMQNFESESAVCCSLYSKYRHFTGMFNILEA